MRISSKVRYGTNALLELALREGEGPVALKDIASSQHIPHHYLGQLISRLIAADMVRSTQGSKGGFTLARPPEDIAMSEVMHIFEGSNALIECLDDPESCSRCGSCVTWDLWNEVNDAVNTILESTTLQDLVERQRQKDASGEVMYYI